MEAPEEERAPGSRVLVAVPSDWTSLGFERARMVEEQKLSLLQMCRGVAWGTRCRLSTLVLVIAGLAVQLEAYLVQALEERFDDRGPFLTVGRQSISAWQA